MKQYLKTLINSVLGRTHKQLNWAGEYIEQLEADTCELLELLYKNNPPKKKTTKKASPKK